MNVSTRCGSSLFQDIYGGVLLLVAAFFSLLVWDTGYAEDDLQGQVEPVEFLINFQVGGNFSGFTDAGVPFYTINGPGYVPKQLFASGEISDAYEKEEPVAQLEGAKITFNGAPTDPIVQFTCLPGSCKLKLKDGAELVSNAGLDLEGRAINMWGPVTKNPNFDPVGGIMPIRIAGCGGLKESAGKGRVANMVGTICFNGILNFNMNDQSVLTGASKCTIALHTPVNSLAIP